MYSPLKNQTPKSLHKRHDDQSPTVEKLSRTSQTILLYIATSAYSGSTLLSFMLNIHPWITTIGHTTGWKFSAGEDFRCSCGERLDECIFYRGIAEQFRHAGLRFDIRDFGTEYRLAKSDRLNRLFCGPIPFITSTPIEKLRDSIVRCFPSCRKALAEQDKANLTLIKTALKLSGARIFVDNSHNPYRLRHLQRISEFRILVVHLFRDPRGIALSDRKNKGWNSDLSVQLWLRRQKEIFRIGSEFPPVLRIYYEDLLSETDQTLARIYRFLEIESLPTPEDLKVSDHHILGNDMRFQPGQLDKIVKWKRDLSKEDQETVVQAISKFSRTHSTHPLSEIIEHYLDSGGPKPGSSDYPAPEDLHTHPK